MDISLPPVTYTGRITDWLREGYSASVYDAEIRARSSEGTLLARSAIKDVEGTPFNFVLSIPLSTEKVSTAACVGDTLQFEVDDGKAVYQLTNGIAKVGAPGTVSYFNRVMLATDANQDGVADEYAAIAESIMPEYGLSGAFDPAADYDGDGVSNFAEYLAGTDPFSQSDSMRVTKILPSSTDTNVMQLFYISGQNRVYSLQMTTNLPSIAFSRLTLLEGESATAAKKAYDQPGTGVEPLRCLYFLKSDRPTILKVKLEE